MKIATREAYGEALKELAAKNKDVVVFDADLAKSTKTIEFKRQHLKDFSIWEYPKQI